MSDIDNIIGNNTQNNTLFDVLMSLKNNTMRSTHVCEICKVIDVRDGRTIKVSPINNSNQTWYAYNFCNFDLAVTQVIIVLFTDTDNRINLTRKDANAILQNTDSKVTHSTDYGIIIGSTSSGDSPEIVWGQIKGEIDNQTDLYNYLKEISNKASKDDLDSLSNQVSEIAGNYLTKSNPSGTGALSMNSTASGTNSVALGTYSTASGNNSIALGEGAIASGETSVALGYGSQATNTYTTSMGLLSIAQSLFQTVMGKCNVIDTSNAYGFIFGIGNSDIDRKNGMTIDWNGNMWLAGNLKLGSDNTELTPDLITQITTNQTNIENLSTDLSTNYLKLSGGTMTGTLNLANMNGNIGSNGIRWSAASLPQATSANYFVVIDAFADGGRQKWIRTDNVVTTLHNAGLALQTSLDTTNTNVSTNTTNIATNADNISSLQTSVSSISGDYVTRTTAQTISGAKTFSKGVVINQTDTWGLINHGTAGSNSIMTRGIVGNAGGTSSDIADLYVNYGYNDYKTYFNDFNTYINTTASRLNGTLTVGGNTTIGGNLTVNGTTTTVSSTTLQVKDKLIEVAYGNTEALTTPAGLVAPLYDGTNSGGLVFDSTGTAYVGDITLDSSGNISVADSDLQPLTTRGDLVDGNLIQWDATNLTLVDSGKAIGDLATTSDLASKQDTLTFDTTPTSGSTNPVTSGGIYTALGDYLTKSNPTGTGSLSLNRKSDTTVGNYSVAVGYNTTASGSASYAEGAFTTASGLNSHAEGAITTASGDSSHSEGYGTTASGNYSHSEGNQTTASGDYSHAEGYNTTASGSYGCSHAEGSGTTASGDDSHAEGGGTTASGNYSHSEGNQTTASGSSSHAEGASTKASGSNSHAEGAFTTASGLNSHAEGLQTTANSRSQHTFGEFNVLDTNTDTAARGTYVEIVGNGTSDTARSNARTLDWSGNEWLAGNLQLGADKTELTPDLIKQISTNKTNIETNTSDISSLQSNKADKTDLTSAISGTANYLPKFTSANVIGNSSVSQANNDITIGGKLIVKTSGTTSKNSYNEGIRVLPASNGWAELYLSADNTTSGSGSGWTIGRRGAVGAVSGAIGDLTIEKGSSSGNGLTLYADGSVPTWQGKALALASDLSSYATTSDLASKQDTLTFDTTPTSGSTNPVTSGGIYTALQNISVEGDYLTKSNPTGTGSLSLNRASGSEIGDYSVAVGYNATASGGYSVAEGYYTTASGGYSVAEGYYTTASGRSSHAEGDNTTANGSDSHAEGWSTTASGLNSHAEGYYTKANSRSQHVFGEYNVLDTNTTTTARGTYVEIVGNGTSSARSNARTLDWSGNEWLAGGLTVGNKWSITVNSSGELVFSV